MSQTNYWNGRIDGTEEDVLRLHQVVEILSLENLLKKDPKEKKVCFISFNSEEGVRRNGGRLGAKDGWKHLKKMMSSFPVYDNNIKFYDLETPITVIDNDLESAQNELAKTVEKLKSLNFLVVVLGGGHEVAYGTYTGIYNYAHQKLSKPQIGIINFDAHFDMRDYDNGASSGTMFLQIAHDCKKRGIDFNYNVLGIQQFSNTQRLFNRAKELNVNYVLASELQTLDNNFLYDITSKYENIHLTVCADVFHIATAPGVSAPQALGINSQLGMKHIKTVAKYAKNLTVDIGEVNPLYDLDDRTSRFMASVIYDIILTNLMEK